MAQVASLYFHKCNWYNTIIHINKHAVWFAAIWTFGQMEVLKPWFGSLLWLCLNFLPAFRLWNLSNHATKVFKAKENIWWSLFCCCEHDCAKAPTTQQSLQDGDVCLGRIRFTWVWYWKWWGEWLGIISMRDLPGESDEETTAQEKSRSSASWSRNEWSTQVTCYTRITVQSIQSHNRTSQKPMRTSKITLKNSIWPILEPPQQPNFLVFQPKFGGYP